jgi:TolB protein
VKHKAVLAVAVVMVGALLASCQVRGAQVAQSPLLRFFERSSGLITYVDGDGNVAVIDQKGGRRKALTNDASGSGEAAVVYAAPTWSPDGKLIAFAQFTVNSSAQVVGAALFTEGRDGKGQKRVFSGTRLQPFYLYWAPDSRRVSFLSEVTGEASMEMGVATAGVEGDYHALDSGAPFYWDWRPDSQSVVVHANMGGADPERLSVLSPGLSTQRSDLGVESGIFQAPSYSPDGKSIVYAASADQGFALHLRALDGSEDKTIANDDGGAFFAFSRDGKRVAYLAAISLQPLPQGKLTVLDVAGKTAPRTLTEEPVLAFFWSPNGRTIAFLVPDTDPGSVDSLFAQNPQVFYMKLMGYDAASGKTWTIARFPPSRGMLAVIPYFDQYGRSATFWSPDSRFIAFTALSADGTPALYVARADGNIKPRFLVSGDYAFWSWK